MKGYTIRYWPLYLWSENEKKQMMKKFPKGSVGSRIYEAKNKSEAKNKFLKDQIGIYGNKKNIEIHSVEERPYNPMRGRISYGSMGYRGF